MKMDRGNFLKLFSTGALGLAVFPFKASWGRNPSMPEVFGMEITEQIRHGASEYDVAFRGGKFSNWLEKLIQKRYLRNGYEACDDDLIEITGTIRKDNFTVRRLNGNIWVSANNKIIEFELSDDCDKTGRFDTYDIRVINIADTELILNNIERGVVIPLFHAIYLNEQKIERNEFAATDELSDWNIKSDNGVSVLLIQPKI